MSLVTLAADSMIGTEEALSKDLRTKGKGETGKLSEGVWACAGGWFLGALCVKPPAWVGGRRRWPAQAGVGGPRPPSWPALHDHPARSALGSLFRHQVLCAVGGCGRQLLVTWHDPKLLSRCGMIVLL